MDLKSHFKLTNVSGTKILPVKKNPFEPIDILIGTWEGRGFNQIWRPHRQQPDDPPDPPNQDRFLELNETTETLEFDIIPGDIPNRGFLQANINLNGIRYLQQVFDANVLENGLKAGIHIENGMW